MKHWRREVHDEWLEGYAEREEVKDRCDRCIMFRERCMMNG